MCPQHHGGDFLWNGGIFSTCLFSLLTLVIVLSKRVRSLTRGTRAFVLLLIMEDLYISAWNGASLDEVKALLYLILSEPSGT